MTFRYYEGGVSSVYLWDLDDGGFAGVVLFKKGRPPRTITMGHLISNHQYSIDTSPPDRQLRFLGFHPRL